jgi:hypothetical protein
MKGRTQDEGKGEQYAEEKIWIEGGSDNDGENCKRRSLIILTLHQILQGILNTGLCKK